MKKTLTTIFLTTSLFSFAAPDAKNADEKKEKTPAEIATDEIKEIRKKKLAALDARFGNLPEESRKTYLAKRKEVKRLINEKRLFEALILIHELQSTFKDDPYVLNMLGAVHVEFRNFEHARKLFDKSLDLAGENPSVLFNLAELSFCKNDWKSCIKQMGALLKKWKMKDSEIYHLVEIKYMLAHLAMSQDKTLSDEQRKEHRATAEEVSGRHGHMDDSPFHYYAQAALCFADDNSREAFKWVMKAKKVFERHPNMTSNWDDTFTEFGFLKSHYGEHFSNQSGFSTDTLESGEVPGTP